MSEWKQAHRRAPAEAAASDVLEPYRNVTIIHGTDWDPKKPFVANSVSNITDAALAKGYSRDQIHDLLVKNSAELAVATSKAPPSAALFTAFHSTPTMVYFSKGVAMPYKSFAGTISKTLQGQPLGPTVLWGCHMENAGQYLATQHNWSNWTALGKAYGNLYGQWGITQW